jgi:hypothetical protein
MSRNTRNTHNTRNTRNTRNSIKDLTLPSTKPTHAGCGTWMGLLKRSPIVPWRRFDVKACLFPSPSLSASL